MSQRKQQILDAALALYEEGGVAAVTAQALVERAEASIGSVYHHYGSLDGVLGALYQRELLSYRESTRQAIDGVDDARGTVQALVTSYLLFVEQNPASARFLFELRFADAMSDQDDELRRGTGSWLKELRQKMGPWIADGTLRDLPQALYAPLIMGPAQDLCRHWLSGRAPGIEALSDVADEVASAAWRAVRGSD